MKKTKKVEVKTKGTSRWIAGGTACVVAVVTLSWSLGMFGTTEDPRVTEIKNLQQDLAKKFKPTQGPASASDAFERVTAITTVMTKVAALPEDLRSEAMQPGKKMMMESMEATVNNYFELPQSEREAYLDNQIRQTEFMRQAFEAGKSVMGAIGSVSYTHLRAHET